MPDMTVCPGAQVIFFLSDAPVAPGHLVFAKVAIVLYHHQIVGFYLCLVLIRLFPPSKLNDIHLI